MRLANHRRMASLSPKMRWKVGSIVSRSRSVSLTSKTIRGKAAISLDSFLLLPSWERCDRDQRGNTVRLLVQRETADVALPALMANDSDTPQARGVSPIHR